MYHKFARIQSESLSFIMVSREITVMLDVIRNEQN